MMGWGSPLGARDSCGCPGWRDRVGARNPSGCWGWGNWGMLGTGEPNECQGPQWVLGWEFPGMLIPLPAVLLADAD